MYQYLLSFALLAHGLIHIRGFLQGIGQWTTRTSRGLHIEVSSPGSRLLAMGWLTTCILFIVAAVLAAQYHSTWPIVGFWAISLSQLLIISSWRLAKAGTLINIIFLLIAIVQYAGFRDARNNRAVAKQLRIEALKAPVMLVTRDRMTALPIAVQRWLSYSGVAGQRVPRYVYLQQQGWMRTSRNQPWMRVQATQYFNLVDPSFLWNARVSRHPLFYFSGADRLDKGRGAMKIKMWSVWPVADGKGAEMDQGSMLRFLGELVWFPAAAVSPYLSWEGINDSTARATFRYGQQTVTGIFFFNREGQFLHFSAKRFMTNDNGATLQDWDIPATSSKSMNGTIIPVSGDAIWKLPEGDLSYYKWQITDIRYE